MIAWRSPRLDGVAVLSFVGAVLFVARVAAGCSGPAKTAAETAYGASLLRCVDEARTLAESKACRAAVDARWGVDGGAR